MENEAEPKPTKVNLVAKLAGVMKAIGRVEKRGQNEAQKYRYATEADVAEAVRVHLADAGLIMIPSVEKLDWRTIEGRNGPLTIATVRMSFTFTDGDESITFRMLGEGMDSGDKNVFKAQTGAEKYALMKFFLIPTGDDPEDDKDEKKLAAAKAPKKADKPKAEPKPGCISEAQKAEVWALARKLFPTTATEKMKRLLADYKVAKTEELPLGPAEDPLGAYDRSLSYYLELEQEAAAPENKR